MDIGRRATAVVFEMDPKGRRGGSARRNGPPARADPKQLAV